jgi:Family of unknown function (DUF5996)
MAIRHENRPEAWPELPLGAWKDTYATLHMWMQIIGKIRMTLSPPVNHWWHVPLYLTARGLTTSPIPYGTETFEINLDFIGHRIYISTSSGEIKSLPLSAISVADFYTQIMDTLASLGIKPKIWPVPVEVADRTRLDMDHTHASYDPKYANAFWRVLAQSDRVFKKFRSGFIGKCSPVHFFWGAPDLAVTRFSGRRAPEHPPVPNVGHFVAIEAYTHECSSCGFWPGGGPIGEAVYYAYAYPEPAAFKDYPARPAAAYYHKDFMEFFLPYEAVRKAKDPDAELLAFMQSTYEAAAVTGNWDRSELERKAPWPIAA